MGMDDGQELLFMYWIVLLRCRHEMRFVRDGRGGLPLLSLEKSGAKARTAGVSE